MLLQKLEYTVRIFKGLILFGNALAVELITPCAFVIVTPFFIVPAENPVKVRGQLELRIDKERSSSVFTHIFHIIILRVFSHIIQDILDHTVNKCYVCP